MQFNKRTMTAAFAVLAALMMIVVIFVAVPGGTDGDAEKVAVEGATPETSTLITSGYSTYYSNFVYANGNAVTIEASVPTDGTEMTIENLPANVKGTDAYLVWTEGGKTCYAGLSKAASVSGGSMDKSLTATSVTMNGGQVWNIFGGSMSLTSAKISVGTATVTINGGTAQYVAGGGWNRYAATGHSMTSLNDIQNDTVNTFVSVTGGKIDSAVVAGGAYSDASVSGTATMTLTGGVVAEMNAGGTNGYTANAVLTVNGVTVKGTYAIGTDTGYGVIATANRGEVAKATVSVLSLGAGSKVIITPGALGAATNSDGGCNAIVRNVSLSVSSSVDSDSVRLLMGIYENLNASKVVNHNPWDTSGPKAPLEGANVTVSAVGKTIEAYDLGGYNTTAETTLHTGTYAVESTKTWTISSGTTLSIPFGGKIVNSGAIVNSGTIEGKGMITLAVKGAELENTSGSVLSTTVSVIGSGDAVFSDVVAGTDGMTITYGSLVIDGTYTTAADGTIIVTGAATISGTIDSGVKISVSGQLTVGADGLVVSSGAELDTTLAVKGTGAGSVLDIEKGAKVNGETAPKTVVVTVSETGVPTVTYRIDLVADNGVSLSESVLYVTAGSSLSGITGIVTVDDGYKFVGWYDASNNYVTSSTVPTDNMVITAIAKKIVTPVTPTDDTNNATVYYISGVVVVIVAILALAAVVLRGKN